MFLCCSLACWVCILCVCSSSAATVESMDSVIVLSVPWSECEVGVCGLEKVPGAFADLPQRSSSYR